jgi:hypothetical protein
MMSEIATFDPSEIRKTACDFTFRGWPPELWERTRDAVNQIQDMAKQDRERKPPLIDLEKHAGYLESP